MELVEVEFELVEWVMVIQVVLAMISQVILVVLSFLSPLEMEEMLSTFPLPPILSVAKVVVEVQVVLELCLVVLHLKRNRKSKCEK